MNQPRPICNSNSLPTGMPSNGGASVGKLSSDELVAALCNSAAYHDKRQVGEPQTDVTKIETHISWVFLFGDFAYKVKKPISTPFLDYLTLENRKHYCEEELRLDRRFAPELYVSVVPITIRDHQVRVEGEGEPIEYALKLRRFPAGAQLQEHLRANQVSSSDIVDLAQRIAQFHELSPRQPQWTAGGPERILANAVDNLSALQPLVTEEPEASLLRSLQIWTRDTFEELEPRVAQRQADGFIRECHGDLHLGNIVQWDGRFIPFDGIEFNEDFRIIDVLNDIAFLTMDLASHHRDDLRFLFRNAYVEQHDDRSSLDLLRWYEVYRALVRAKVALLRSQQLDASGGESVEAKLDRDLHIALAHRLSSEPPPVLTITHGLSGSGKSTYSEQLVARTGAIRIRADVERKRLFGLNPINRVNERQLQELYSPAMTQATYAKLYEVAGDLLGAGYSVVLDATFLKHAQRRMMHDLADRLKVDFAILDCPTDLETLKQRLLNRQREATDPSDADVAVLEMQLASQEPLTESEQSLIAQLPPELS